MYHILKKHKESRRPHSWRVAKITQSRDESIRQLLAIKEVLEEVLESSGSEAMRQKFSDLGKLF